MKQFSEEELREEAKKRVEFKSHALTYVVINIGIWLLYLIINRPTSPPWPVWATVGWGIGLAFHYLGVYHMSSLFSVEKEMDKMRKDGK